MTILAHITGYETSTLVAVFALGIAVGAVGGQLVRLFFPMRSR
jgi:hypothetical protein